MNMLGDPAQLMLVLGMFAVLLGSIVIILGVRGDV